MTSPRSHWDEPKGAATEPAHFERDDDDSAAARVATSMVAATEPAHFERDDVWRGSSRSGVVVRRNGARSF